jgi:hypothetical protein
MLRSSRPKERDARVASTGVLLRRLVPLDPMSPMTCVLPGQTQPFPAFA